LPGDYLGVVQFSGQTEQRVLVGNALFRRAPYVRKCEKVCNFGQNPRTSGIDEYKDENDENIAIDTDVLIVRRRAVL